MKGLLHSKRFKQNLAKWLFMYVGVMMLLTTVITYSKYISSFGVSDEARSTKFSVKIKPDDNITCDGVTCNLGSTRPTSLIEYGFTINVEEVEVTSDLYITITLDDSFKFDTNEGITSNVDFSENDYETNQPNIKTIHYKVDLKEDSIKDINFNLKIRAKDIYQKFDSEDKEIVTIGYSIKQVK